MGQTLAPDRPVDLGRGLGRLVLERTAADGIAAAVAEAGLQVAFREGGERLRTSAGGPNRRLKQLMQDAGILPWMRSQLPLLTSDGRLVQVADLWTAAEFQARGGYVVRWEDRPALA